jgi:hypothetical protein
VPAYEAAVDELEERAEHVGAPRRPVGDRLHRVEAEVAGEDAESNEQGPRVGGQQVDAPLDRGLNGSLPHGQVSSRGREQREHPVQPPEHGCGCEGADAGRRQLDRERHSFERTADARDLRRVVDGDVEARIGRSCAVPEQAHGRRFEDLLQ